MEKLTYVKFEKISLKDHPEFNEKWVQERIIDDPSILGLGDVILKDKERIQPHGGRLDLLLQDPDSTSRYEVEIQLGRTNESHIIRTLEYWDVERKRYPQYDHTAVIIAEDITSRFLNVVGLFNGFIPLIAIQMHALKYEENVSLICTTVLDQMSLGLVEEDEEQEVVDRSYWEKKGTKATVALGDELIKIVKEFDAEFELKYNKFYIGLAKEGRPLNFASFRPRKNGLRLDLKMKKSERIEEKLDELGIDLIDYSKWGTYRIRITKSAIDNNSDFLKELLQDAYTEWTNA